MIVNAFSQIIFIYLTKKRSLNYHKSSLKRTRDLRLVTSELVRSKGPLKSKTLYELYTVLGTSNLTWLSSFNISIWKRTMETIILFFLTSLDLMFLYCCTIIIILQWICRSRLMCCLWQKLRKTAKNFSCSSRTDFVHLQVLNINILSYVQCGVQYLQLPEVSALQQCLWHQVVRLTKNMFMSRKKLYKKTCHRTKEIIYSFNWLLVLLTELHNGTEHKRFLTVYHFLIKLYRIPAIVVCIGRQVHCSLRYLTDLEYHRQQIFFKY